MTELVSEAAVGSVANITVRSANRGLRAMWRSGASRFRSGVIVRLLP